MRIHPLFSQSRLAGVVKDRRWPLVIGGMALIHLALLLINYLRIPRTFGYDWPGHFAYLFFIDASGQTPPPDLSAQFFNPPLYYLTVSAFHRLTGVPLVSAGQLLNVGLAVISLLLVVAICRRLWADDLLPAALCVGIYAFNPTIFRTFGMTRPEPLLLPIFLGVAWLVLTGRQQKSVRFALLSGLLAGLAFGVRQWGAFLVAGLGVWLVWDHVRHHGWRRWRPLLLSLTLLSGAFGVVAGVFLLFRGGSPLAFNAQPQEIAWGFLLRLDLDLLFSQPVRPHLDFRFWPILYADFWGDYWRYWWEALGRDPLASSPATVSGLSRAMWGALPASGLVLLGWVAPAAGQSPAGGERRLLSFARILVAVTMAGFLVFATLYADGGKGDTVKSVYLAYLVPFAGILAGYGALFLRRQWRPFRWAMWATLLLLALFVLPATLYRPPEQMLSRTWAAPEVARETSTTFAEAYTLVGYEAERMDDGVLEVRLVWRADGYTGQSHKVFVHLLDDEGEMVAQSDAIPAGWTRPTYGWMLGEVITDVHRLTLPPDGKLPSTMRIGWYGEPGSDRLLTGGGADAVLLPLEIAP